VAANVIFHSFFCCNSLLPGEKGMITLLLNNLTLFIFKTYQNLPDMSTNWKKAQKQIAAYKEHIKGLPKNTPRAYTLTVEEIDRLLKQRKGKRLEGIRIYIGAETKKGVMVPNLIIVGCAKGTDGQLNDYNVPKEVVKASSKILQASATGPVLGDTRPCPDWCGESNALNQ
jgi:hypothetical protein